MAWIEQHRRADGGLTARVIWRPGGAGDATRVWETTVRLPSGTTWLLKWVSQRHIHTHYLVR
jgi:hypothetical protein